MYRYTFRNQSRIVKEKDRIKSWKIIRGDQVQIMTGKDKGERGEILKVKRYANVAKVNGLNLVKKATSKGAKPDYLMRELPIHVSNLALIDPVDNLPCRVGWKFLENGEKVRVSKRSQKIIPKPSINREKVLPPAGVWDTAPETVLKVTFDINSLLKHPKAYARPGPLEVPPTVPSTDRSTNHLNTRHRE